MLYKTLIKCLLYLIYRDTRQELETSTLQLKEIKKNNKELEQQLNWKVNIYHFPASQDFCCLLSHMLMVLGS